MPPRTNDAEMGPATRYALNNNKYLILVIGVVQKTKFVLDFCHFYLGQFIKHDEKSDVSCDANTTITAQLVLVY